jgi:mannose-6-phosphate isomerase-like protein (cupin superfamily)
VAESILPSVYRGRPRNTPQKHIRFEYRIDRKHRVLHREDMFPNPFHPSGLDMTEEFFVCNSMHSHNLRVGLEGVGPGASFTFPDYPNEHLLLHIGGEMIWRVAGESFESAPGDQIFTPAFVPYTVINTANQPAWLISGYARVDEWLGREPRETRIAPGCETHRFLPCMNGPFTREGNG